MKRYVKEFANDVMRKNSANTLMRADIREKIEKDVRYIVEEYKAGLITDSEAVWQIAKIDTGF